MQMYHQLMSVVSCSGLYRAAVDSILVDMTLISIMSVLFFFKVFFQSFSSKYFRFVMYFSFFKLFAKNSIDLMLNDVILWSRD